MEDLKNRMQFFAPDGGGGGADGGGDGGADGGDGGGDHWLDSSTDYADLAADDSARKTLSKYKTVQDALKGHAELQSQFRQSFRVPDTLEGLPDDEVGKITDRLKGILKPEHLGRMRGAPDSVDGYKLKVPEGANVDPDGMKAFLEYALSKGWSQEETQGIFDLNHDFVARMQDARSQAVVNMANANAETFLKDDCGGDKDLMALRMENVKRLLQMQFVGKDGKVDSKAWEQFASRMYCGDRMTELPILRALHQSAQMLVGTGGANASSGPGPGGSGSGEIDVNARWPKSAHIMDG